MIRPFWRALVWLWKWRAFRFLVAAFAALNVIGFAAGLLVVAFGG